ncbi:MAG: hypothetical protein A2901_04675 [Elusimicrobia bacterium RIFCSPLOWO2_01_FULL_54_10]|nr:MAG: hypothetical protein A2901_04675 [Elusimicrobia bacterium RIFCSPLOWO2_01_FULL_54_10]
MPEIRKLVAVAALLLAASPAQALVIDDFYKSSSITAAVDIGSSLTNSLVSGPNGLALKMDYALGTGNYVVAVVDFSTQNFSDAGGNTARFRYKASGQSNTLELKFSDSDSTTTTSCDKLSLKFLTVPDSQWRTVTVALSSFSLFPDGNSNFDLSKVSRMSVGLTQDNSSRGSGTLWLDNIELYKSTFTLIDDFQDQAEPNFFGGTNLNTGTSGGATSAVTYASLGADNVLQYAWNNNAVGSFSFIFMNLQKNFQGYTHLSFRIRGNAGGEWVKIKLESAPGNSQELFISTYLAGGITTTFQTVQIPLTAFTGVSFSTLNVLTVVTTNDASSGAGTVWFDDIGFARSTDLPGVIRTLDDFDSDVNASNWEKYTHADAALNVSSPLDSTAPGATGSNRVYKLEYTFTTNPSFPAATPYAVIERPFQISLAAFNGIKFQYLGTGANNNVELKLTDFDGTTWFKKFLMITDSGGIWKRATAPFSQFTLFSSGDDAALNLKRVRRVEIAVARGSGGSGTFTVDSLEAPGSGEFEQFFPGKLISSVRIVNNPFSPNGDAFKDEVFFVYRLDAQSKVTLKIYGTGGRDVKTVARVDQAAGEQSVAWDGTDDSGAKASNGLYLFVLEAEGSDSRKDAVRQTVAVLR